MSARSARSARGRSDGARSRRKQLGRRSAAVVAGALAIATPAAGTAHAADVRIAGFVTREAGLYILDEPAFDAFLRDALGAAAPTLGLTGATSGAGGLDVTLGFGWQPVARGSAAWQDALGTGAPGALVPFVLSARKGFPDNLELGVHVAHLGAIDMTSASLELGWAVIEGEDVLPDIGIRADVGGIFGNPDATLLDAGASVVVGKRFALAGLVRVAPYAGYAFRLGQTLERRVALIGGVDATAFETTLPAQTVQLHEGVIGVRFGVAPVELVLEGRLGTTNGLRFTIGAAL